MKKAHRQKCPKKSYKGLKLGLRFQEGHYDVIIIKYVGLVDFIMPCYL